MKTIKFTLRESAKANEAINDYPVLRKNIIQISCNVYEFEDEFEDILINQLENWDIDITEYEIINN